MQANKGNKVEITFKNLGTGKTHGMDQEPQADGSIPLSVGEVIKDPQVAVRDTTFDNIGKIKSAWIIVNNRGKEKNQLEITLEVNGVEKVIQSHFIPGLDPSEGHTLHSTSLSWLFKAR